MKMFIRRKKIIGYHQKNYLNIARYTQKLLTLNPFDKAQKQDLIHQIEQEEVLTERNWLLEQLSR